MNLANTLSGFKNLLPLIFNTAVSVNCSWNLEHTSTLSFFFIPKFYAEFEKFCNAFAKMNFVKFVKIKDWRHAKEDFVQGEFHTFYNFVLENRRCF